MGISVWAVEENGRIDKGIIMKNKIISYYDLLILVKQKKFNKKRYTPKSISFYNKSSGQK